ncbi:MAG: hypothetical protein AAB250_15520 [Bdellovibrionota bacterium]
MKTNLKISMIAAALLLGSIPGFANAEGSFDLGIESEAAFVDSESAIAEAEDARRRALEEREQLRQAKKIAAREASRARVQEDGAKKKIGRWMEQEKFHHTERVVTEKRTEKAREEMRKIQAKLDAKEAELKALQEIVEQQVGERDRVEMMVEQAQEKITRIEAKIREEQKKKAAVEAETLVSREKLKMNRERVRELARRSPSSVRKAPVASAGTPKVQ